MKKETVLPRKNCLTTAQISNKINKKTGGKNMLVTTKEMFEKSMKEGYAIGAFNVNNMEIIQGIVDAAAGWNGSDI